MKKIALYKDEGVSLDGLEHMRQSIREIAGQTPVLIDAKTLAYGSWEENTLLLILPGGRDRFYHQSLFPEGTRRIREFVQNGGEYLGICAGAYFGASHIEFEKGGELEIIGERDLQFFPGIAVGPAYGLGEFRYDDSGGVRVARVLFSDGLRAAGYFHGGCFFQDPQKFLNVEVMAHYEDLSGHPAAIISCKVGKGRAILSGVHLEYSPHSIRDDLANIVHVKDMLLEQDAFRRDALKKILMTNR